MIPTVETDLQDFEFAQLPSRTFRIDMENNFISGYIDELQAMRQAVYLMLNVERFEYLIYSWDYGVELADLTGKSMPFCLSEIKRRVSEALLQDDRITGVDNFSFSTDKRTISVTFDVTTQYGTISAERTVEV